MKTPETKASAQPRRMNLPEEPKKKGAFAKVLERKAGEEKTPEAGGENAPRLSPRTDLPEAPVPVRSAASVRDLDGLAHEISISLRGADLKEVHIQMDSKTMAGLQIRISKENGKLNVRLQSESADISRMLAQQTDALAQRLETRGYPGAVVQVQSPPAATLWERPVRYRREQGSRDQGNQEQRRDRQK